MCRLNPTEQKTMLTLWCIARSPLMLGSALDKPDPSMLALLTNPEVPRVNQHGCHQQPLFRGGYNRSRIAWVSWDDEDDCIYLALFNTWHVSSVVEVDLATYGILETYAVRDLWARIDLAPVHGRIDAVLPAHGSALYRLSPLSVC